VASDVPRRFVEQRRQDPYYRAAQREGLRSRAAFKLAHLAEHYPIFGTGDRVLDLGAAPGGWSLVAADLIGPSGEVVAVDPRGIDPIDGVVVLHGRVGDPRLAERLRGRPFDVVLSDMSPSISGAYATDHARSVALVEAAFALAEQLLRPKGRFVAKVFEGDLVRGLDTLGRARFAKWVHTKPPASRSTSSELYVIGLGFLGGSRARPARREAPEGPGASGPGVPVA
jgi:23S rRNA (uridine2552-2'-O)-methyltransferase